MAINAKEEDNKVIDIGLKALGDSLSFLNDFFDKKEVIDFFINNIMALFKRDEILKIKALQILIDFA